MLQGYDPQVKVSQRGIGEPAEVDLSGATQFFAFRLADGAGELCPADATDAHCFQGDGAGDGRIAAEFLSVPGGRVGGDDQVVIFLIPRIEARGAPRTTFADGGDAQHMMSPEQRPYSFMKFMLFHRNVSIVNFILL